MSLPWEVATGKALVNIYDFLPSDAGVREQENLRLAGILGLGSVVTAGQNGPECGYIAAKILGRILRRQSLHGDRRETFQELDRQDLVSQIAWELTPPSILELNRYLVSRQEVVIGRAARGEAAERSVRAEPQAFWLTDGHVAWLLQREGNLTDQEFRTLVDNGCICLGDTAQIAWRLRGLTWETTRDILVVLRTGQDFSHYIAFHIRSRPTP